MKQCPACSKTNPADALFCFYDGRNLSNDNQQGPLRVGALPFPMPFCFSDGTGCSNFNQLALACDERWNEARSLLSEGIWPAFFAAIGRLDLAAAAKQAAKEPDPDVGLSQLLEKFPADPDALRLPKLGVQSPEETLGPLAPGADHRFEVTIKNQGMLVLRGMIFTACDWLVLGDRPGPCEKILQTRNIFSLPVRIQGNKLRAGRKPLEGEIVIDTNGGQATVPVRVNVPIRPFPKGQYANDSLAGATSPHELALKAKAHPQEAAVLFEQGAVRAWYASNGWTYPVEGTTGSGKGAIQQFFEALGLTKAPKLKIDAKSLIVKGRPGRKITKQILVSTDEPKPVYAQAWSTQDWVKVLPSKSRGNQATVTLEITVPPYPGETIQTGLTIQGNGKQRFEVPLTVAVVSAQADPEPEEAEEVSSGSPIGWIFAVAACLLLLVGVGIFFVVMRNRQQEESNNGAPVVQNPQLPPGIAQGGVAQAPGTTAAQTGRAEVWWDGMPDVTIPATLAALKKVSPPDEAIFDGIAAKADGDRYQAYERLATKLPDLVRNPQVREPLGRLVTDCYVFEPSEPNITPLRRVVTNQIPQDRVAFRPEDKGEELDRAFWSLGVELGALTHKGMATRPDRARSLAMELGAVFGFTLDVGVPAEQLKEQTEKLLAVRCYRNTVPTAARSIDHALTMRGMLIDRLPKQLSPTFRETVDVDLLAIGLSKGSNAWGKVEPILKACLESNDLTIGLKIVDIYQHADAAVAPKMEELMAPKWKVAGDVKMKQSEKANAIRASLVGAAARAKITPAERLAQLQKLTTAALIPEKDKGEGAQKKETLILQDTLRLSHASTMACLLLQKEAGGTDRFDDLVARVPELEQAETSKTGDTKTTSNEGPAQQPAAGGVVSVGAQPRTINGRLDSTCERNPQRPGSFRVVHRVTFKAGQLYTIDMISGAFDSYLRLEDPNGLRLAEDDDGGGYPNARIVHAARSNGNYRVIATSFGGGTGPYTLHIQQTSGLGGGFGLGGGGLGFGGGFGALGGFGGVNPRLKGRGLGMAAPGMEGNTGGQQQQGGTKQKQEGQVSASDLAELESKQSNVRVTAYNNIARAASSDLPPKQAQKIAKYMLVTASGGELDDVAAKLDSFAKCRHLLLALADLMTNDGVAQKNAEVVVGGVLGQSLQFARDEEWRFACKRMLLQRGLELTGSGNAGAEQAAEVLRDLYREQGLALGIEESQLAPLTRPGPVLECVIKNVAAKAGQQNLSPEDKQFLEQIDRQLRAAQYIAENDLEHTVLLQRTWIKVLSLSLQAQAPGQAKAMLAVEQDLVNQDRRARGVLEQLRSGEEKILRVWALALNLK